MLRDIEKNHIDSCLNRARPDEMCFTLLARDASAPVAIRAWVEHRVSTGKNTIEDKQIKEALEAAKEMERYRESLVPGRGVIGAPGA